ncbi:redoxin domain-containing protein [Alcanivorax jadensis T9]|jgi:peroxiredoxin|uniref:Redoxin domain-containing protein n=1 Tax=Alcanivorax jadensis T9 TaxID=1177181 RepID=A0ABR4WF79_9GAMM|nr:MULTISPECIES: TlpA disulfide reductase family protein [Alcanivorax]KGD62231.1 redoxin domain-containing protein [Alcanivorax jadensis T9]MAC13285.1 TlpA family protein disulfide reductase [Alcanivorax sp.]MBG32365.1 TlpA family protein disulfide reductase [Alcanivorax sp.]MBP22189.1 TlpA family protein disulfide reductase [Alcanivorax sp.]MDF1636357.1 TlpA disulfide reductase family protein [Alcanivorax jadensis]|tara:strand:+ start:801 stop:1295 length:495 start_codon:yes stop_codon:yes gene_type:complete
MKKTLMLVIGALALIFSSNALAAEEGAPAPDFTLKTLDGSNLKLSEQRGTVILLNFWASWCGPCRTEMPLLDDLYQEYRDYGFTVLGVNLDENRDQADRLLDKIPVTFPVLFDPQNSTSETYGVDAMPTTVLIDRNGVVRHHHRGYKDGYMDKYEDQVKALVLE